MAQNPYNAQTSVQTTSGGQLTALNVTAATVIKGSPGRVFRITVNTVPTSSAVSVNDAATTGAAAASNLILNAPSASLTAGQVITLEFPCANGIVVNPGTSGVVSVSYL
jgi:hypothetical protein